MRDRQKRKIEEGKQAMMRNMYLFMDWVYFVNRQEKELRVSLRVKSSHHLWRKEFIYEI